MEIRVGYELIYDCPQLTPMMLVLHIHYSRASDIIVPDHVTTTRRRHRYDVRTQYTRQLQGLDRRDGLNVQGWFADAPSEHEGEV